MDTDHQTFIWPVEALYALLLFLCVFMHEGDAMAVFSTETEAESSDFVSLSAMNWPLVRMIWTV
jgi:hypothetical protein